MALKVAYPAPLDDQVLEDLKELTGSDVSVSRSLDEGTTVLIDGRPTVEQLEQAPNLRAVIVPFAGVPLETLRLVAERPQLTLHNLHHNAPETAELALGLLFAAAKRVVTADQLLRRNDWSLRYDPSRTIRLEGKTAVILGFGEIGRRIGRGCESVGMSVIGVRRSKASDACSISELDELLPKADVLVVALPHTAETTGLLDSRRLGLLPLNAILINIARGQVVDEQALYEALLNHRIHSAGLDVWYRYPAASKDSVPGYFEMPPSALNTPPSSYPFGELENVVLSPHRGGASMDSERSRVEHLARLVVEYAKTGAMSNQVDLAAGY